MSAAAAIARQPSITRNYLRGIAMRRIGRVSILLGSLLVAACGGSTAPQDNAVAQVPSGEPIADKDACQNSNLVLWGIWIGSDEDYDRITYSVTKVSGGKRPPEVELRITDQDGDLLYSYLLSSVERIYTANMLRTGRSQLVIEYSGGGQDSYIRILDLRKGKQVVDLTKDEGLDMAFSSDAHVSAQFAPGVNSAKEPFQILLTNPGLPASGEKVVSVYRFRDGQYRLYGTYRREQADKLIEQMIKRE